MYVKISTLKPSPKSKENTCAFPFQSVRFPASLLVAHCRALLDLIQSSKGLWAPSVGFVAPQGRESGSLAAAARACIIINTRYARTLYTTVHARPSGNDEPALQIRNDFV